MVGHPLTGMTAYMFNAAIPAFSRFLSFFHFWLPGVLVWMLWRWIGARDWRAGAVLGAVAAGWLPWVILYSHRTIFTFYEVAFAPFMVMALTFAIGAIIGTRDASPTRRTWGAASVGGYLLLVIASTAWIWPLLVGTVLSQQDWLRRLWFRGWI